MGVCGLLVALASNGEAQSPPLQAAVRTQNLPVIERLVASGADVNSFDEAGSTPLMTAVLAGNSAITAFLLAHGAQPDTRQQHTQATALLYAISSRRADLAAVLLRAGAQPDLKFTDGQNALHVAAANNSAAVIDALLSARADVDSRDANGKTPLDTAILHGSAQAVSALLSHGADVHHATAANQRGALHEACERGYAAIASLLIDAGADPTALDTSGQTPLDLALAYKNESVVAVLFHVTPQRRELREIFERTMKSAAERGRTAVVRMLLDAGWDVNRQTTEGLTYLHNAAFKGQSNVVRLLVERGAHVDAQDFAGETPLHDAAISGNAETIAILLDHGAQIDRKDTESGATPLMLAASLGRTEAVALLVKRGANLAVADRSGRTALIRAQESQDTDVLKLLQSAGKVPPHPVPANCFHSADPCYAAKGDQPPHVEVLDWCIHRHHRRCIRTYHFLPRGGSPVLE